MAPKKLMKPYQAPLDLAPLVLALSEPELKGSSSHISFNHSQSGSNLPGSSTNRSTGRSIPWEDLSATDPYHLPVTEARAGLARENGTTTDSGTIKQNPPVISRDWRTSENRVQRSVDKQTANGHVASHKRIASPNNKPAIWLRAHGPRSNEFDVSKFCLHLKFLATVLYEDEGFRIEFDDSDQGRAAPSESYRFWHNRWVQDCHLEIKIISEGQQLDTETRKRNHAVPNTSEGANRRRDSINARVEPTQKATDQLNSKNNKSGEFVRANHGDDNMLTQETTASNIDYDKTRSDKIMGLLSIFQAVDTGPSARNKVAINDDAASSISGLTTSDTSRSKKATCHICQQNISTGSAIEVKCSTCSRRYHSHCLRDKDTTKRFEIEKYRCRRCVQKGVKAAPSTSSISRDPDGKAVKRRKLENESSATSQLLKRSQYTRDDGFNMDSDAIEVRHWSNGATKPVAKVKASTGHRSEFESSATSNGDEAALNPEKTFPRERLPRAPAQRPVMKPSGSKGRIAKRPSKTELVPCEQCKVRNVPLLPSGQQMFCPDCKTYRAVAERVAQLRKTQTQEKATDPSEKTQSNGIDPSTSIRPNPVREATKVIENDHSSKSKSPLPIANANYSDVAGPKEPSIAALDDESTEACWPSVAQEKGLSHAGDADIGQDAMDANDCCIDDSIIVKPRLKTGVSRDSTKAATSTECSNRATCESTVASQNRTSRNPNLGRPDIDMVTVEPAADDAARQRVPNPPTCSNISSRLKSRLSDEEGRGLCYSLFTELPQLDPKNQTHWADKMDEIKSRLRRKDLMERSTLYSPLGMKKIVDTRKAAKRIVMEPGAPAAENGEETYTVSIEDDGRKIHAYESLDDFLGGLEEQDVVTVREREVCYRDGTRKMDGTFARTRNAYPTGV